MVEGEGVNIVTNIDEGDTYKFQHQRVLHVHIFEPFLLREGRVANLSCILHLLIDVDFPIYVLSVQRSQKFLGFRSILLDLNVVDVEECFEHTEIFDPGLFHCKNFDDCQEYDHYRNHDQKQNLGLIV